MANIFISYRWDDSAGETGRIHDHLNKHFGEDRVFIDVKGIELGEDIPAAIEKTVKQCKVLLVVIGKIWASIADEKTGKPRLENPNDAIRLEISTALKEGLWIIPVLVNEASMPIADELPNDISAITGKKAAEIKHNDFEHGVEVLIGGIERAFEREQEEEQSIIRMRESKVNEVIKALEQAFNKDKYVRIEAFSIKYDEAEKALVAEKATLQPADFNETLGNIVKRGWAIFSQRIITSSLIILTKKWDTQIPLASIAEELITINLDLGATLDSLDVLVRDQE